MSEAILAFAHDRNVTKIVVGKPRRSLWQRMLLGSIVDALVRGSGDIDIEVISGEREDATPIAPVRRRAIPTEWAPYVWATAVVALASGVAWLTLPFFELANLVMVYLLGIVVVATHYGQGPSLLSSVLSVAALDFLFVPPVYTFAVSDVRYLFLFAVMLVVGLVTSSLAARIRTQADAASQRERRTASLYAMSRELASARRKPGAAVTTAQSADRARPALARISELIVDRAADLTADPGALAALDPGRVAEALDGSLTPVTQRRAIASAIALLRASSVTWRERTGLCAGRDSTAREGWKRLSGLEPRDDALGGAPERLGAGPGYLRPPALGGPHCLRSRLLERPPRLLAECARRSGRACRGLVDEPLGPGELRGHARR